MSTEKKHPEFSKCPVIQKCAEINDLEQENIRMWTAIGQRITIRMVVTILGLLGTAYLTLFGLSVNMNSHAINKVESAREQHQTQLKLLSESLHTMALNVTELQGIVQINTNQIQDCQKKFDEIGRYRIKSHSGPETDRHP